MLPHNLALADHLEGIAYYEDLWQIENYEFRSSAYRVAARLFRKLGYEILTSMEAETYKGVGKKIGKRVEEFARTGNTRKLVKLRAEDEDRDAVIRQLLRVREISIVRANDLYTKAKVRSLDDLFQMRDQLSYAEWGFLTNMQRYEEPVPREEVFAFERDARNVLPSNIRAIAVGAYRRGKPDNEIHLLLTYSSPPLLHIREVLKSFVLLIREPWSSPDALTTFRGVTHNYRVVNIRLQREMHYAPALLHATGPDEFRVDMRVRAQHLGLHLNEYRLARGALRPPVVKKARAIAGSPSRARQKITLKITESEIENEDQEQAGHPDEQVLPTPLERDIFRSLDLAYVIPAQRTVLYERQEPEER